MRVRVERAQHSGDRAVVDGLIGVQRIGEVLFNDGIEPGEVFHVGADFVIAASSRGDLRVRPVNAAENAAGEDHDRDQEKRPAFARYSDVGH